MNKAGANQKAHSFGSGPRPRKPPLATNQAAVAKGKGTVRALFQPGMTNFRSVLLASPTEAELLPRVPPLCEPRARSSSLRCSGRGAAAGGGGSGGSVRDAEFPGTGGEDGGRQGPPALPAHRSGRQVSGWGVAAAGPPGLRGPGRGGGRGPAAPPRPCSSRGLRGPAALRGDPRPGLRAHNLPRPARHPQFVICRSPTSALLGSHTSASPAALVPKLSEALSCQAAPACTPARLSLQGLGPHPHCSP